MQPEQTPIHQFQTRQRQLSDRHC